MGEEAFDLGFAHRSGMPLVVKADETAYPVKVGSFSAMTEVLDAHSLPCDV